MRLMLFVALMGFCCGGSFQVTPQARILVDAFVDAARYLGYQRKQIAEFQGLDGKQWDRQFYGEAGAHPSAFRMALAPAPVIREWIKRIAPAFGLRVFDRTDDIVRLIDALEAHQSSRQLRVTLPEEQERRTA